MRNHRRFGPVLAGFVCLISVAPAWAAVGFGSGQSLDGDAFLTEAREFPTPAVPRMTLASHGSVKTGKPSEPVKFVPIGGGKFMMGNDKGLSNAKPVHEVAIEDFEMSRTLVTVEQYAECVSKGRCTEPNTDQHAGDTCNWGKEGRQLHPVNCVDWEQADKYAKFMEARLPSESEWEYAAKSGGKPRRNYPWGDTEPTCRTAVMLGDGGDDCGYGDTMPVCSKPDGNTAQGLCDMSGNVWQWVQDEYRDSYAYAPTDGRAYESAGSLGVLRGGSFHEGDKYAGELRTDFRYGVTPSYRFGGVGFRLARSRR